MSDTDFSGVDVRQGAPLGSPQAVTFRISDQRRSSYRRHREPGSTSTTVLARIESLLARDATYRRHLREVLRRQRTLRERVSVVGWRAYLELEQAEFDRWAHALERASRWALGRGRRERGRR
jgi:hypothetical protein